MIPSTIQQRLVETSRGDSCETGDPASVRLGGLQMPRPPSGLTLAGSPASQLTTSTFMVSINHCWMVERTINVGRRLLNSPLGTITKIVFFGLQFGTPIFGKPIFGKPMFWKPIFGKLIFWKTVFGKPFLGNTIFWKTVFGKPFLGKPFFWKTVFGKPFLENDFLQKYFLVV